MSDQARQRNRWWRGERGEWYVFIQGGLLVLLIFGPRTVSGLPQWPAPLMWPSLIAGGLIALCGAVLAFSGVWSLGRNLTPLPRPKEDADLVERGAYRLVRHPIYGGIILLAYGWALCIEGWLTLVYSTIVFIFLDRKSRREERWLMEKYPGYRGYAERTRRLIPFIY